MRDEQAFAGFVRAQGTALVRTAFLLVGDRADAEDLTQVALLRLSRRWDRVDDPAAYARTTLARLAVDRWRALRRRPPHLALVDDDRAADPTNAAADRVALLGALRTLPARQRAVLVLRYYEGLSEADIATALGCSAGTVKTHAARGMARLREAFGEEGER
ncbi:MAG TPA: SigE family RNA polymerase sigma factor [Mycobacteriales bacterium]|jgi:RNA polymerase sigma-70 factor (sigma-E family)